MPRSARLDVPNVLQHVMARGIEGREIFRDKKDREEFLRRLSEVVIKGKGQLFAWSLISNHFHLLLRPRGMPLATMMRRLLTGYAVWHNRRHARKGHLFQNRYKSIVVEEDPYFLELVRYIHLNPVRARMLGHLSELDRFPYTGHAVIIGHRDYGCQDVDAVLEWFGKRAGRARRGYRGFIEAGFEQGRREDLRGGGLIRSAGGRGQLVRRATGEWQLGDERILGGGAFVEGILKGQTRPVIQTRGNLEDILGEVCKEWGVLREQILSSSRVRTVSRARGVFFLRAHVEAGESMSALGRLCGFAHTSVREAIERAREERDEGH
jgi:putative transposase